MLIIVMHHVTPQHQKSAKFSKKMNASESYILNSSFYDFTEFSKTVSDWKIEFQQLRPGQFKAELFQVKCGVIHFGYTHLVGHFHQRGESPQGLRTFVIPATPEQNFRWRNQEITGNTVAIFPHSNELDANLRGNFKIFALSLPEEAIIEVARSLNNSFVIDLINTTERVYLADSTMFMLRAFLKQIHQTLINDINLLNVQEVSKEVETNLANQLVMALSTSQDTGETFSPQVRQKAIKKALAYIYSFSNEPVKVNDLCNITGVSPRTLYNGFQEHFSVSPKTYLLTYRLNNVGKILWHAPPTSVKTSDIANQWGFWHIGQFATDYRKLFGELPSKTLADQH